MLGNFSESARGDEYIPRSRTRDIQECLPHQIQERLPQMQERLSTEPPPCTLPRNTGGGKKEDNRRSLQLTTDN